jgi:hypothetical protein
MCNRISLTLRSKRARQIKHHSRKISNQQGPESTHQSRPSLPVKFKSRLLNPQDNKLQHLTGWRNKTFLKLMSPSSPILPSSKQQRDLLHHHQAWMLKRRLRRRLRGESKERSLWRTGMKNGGRGSRRRTMRMEPPMSQQQEATLPRDSLRHARSLATLLRQCLWSRLLKQENIGRLRMRIRQLLKSLRPTTSSKWSLQWQWMAIRLKFPAITLRRSHLSQSEYLRKKRISLVQLGSPKRISLKKGRNRVNRLLPSLSRKIWFPLRMIPPSTKMSTGCSMRWCR